MMTEKEQYAIEEVCRNDLYTFNRYMFLKRRGFKWLHNWHHEKICEALERVYNGECKRLIINIPPRYSKTELAVINFAAWAMGKNPDSEFIHASYSATLAEKNGGQVRDLIDNEYYKRIFNTRLDSTAKGYLTTTKGGAFYTVGTGGTLTGFGAGKPRKEFGGCIIIDDPHKADEASSDVRRENVIEWFQNTLESRTNSPDTPIIVIMQRLHEEDLSGWLLNGGNGEEWEHLCLPVLSDDNIPLWDTKHDLDDIERIRKSNSYVFNGQYMQKPYKKGGDIIKRDWFRFYSVPPSRFKRVIQTSDTAQKTKERNDYSVILTGGLCYDGNVYLLDLIRGKWEAPELEKTMKLAWEKWKHLRTQAMYVEDKASGTSLIQNIQRKKCLPIKAVQVDSDKYTRVLGVTGYIESGYIYIPENLAWVLDFLEECEKFTANDTHKHDDQVDSLVMMINELLMTVKRHMPKVM